MASMRNIIDREYSVRVGGASKSSLFGDCVCLLSMFPLDAVHGETTDMNRTLIALYLVGQGAYGPVYKAQMSTGEIVAVKVLATDSKQGEREFETEVKLLGRLHHRNLLNLLGYCTEKGKNMLIYATMSNTDNSSVPMDDESEVGNENATTKSTKVGDKRKSEYWNHFWDFRDPVTKKIVQVKCKYCEKMLTGNTNNGTSSLKKHLGACSKYPPNVDKKQKLISVYKSPESDATIVSNWKFDETACRLGLARMVIVDEQPFSIVEREGFRASNVCIDIERFLEDVQKYEEELDGSDTGITQVNEFVGNN
uniref:BED-type domain-containing protein n=1 Tax=Chenopodium quinoa TaxID=63459 RepID=A0A803MLK3_CHEQI